MDDFESVYSAALMRIKSRISALVSSGPWMAGAAGAVATAVLLGTTNMLQRQGPAGSAGRYDHTMHIS